MEQQASSSRNLPGSAVEIIHLGSNSEVGTELTKYVVQPFSGNVVKKCVSCSLWVKPKYSATNDGIISYICDNACLNVFKTEKKTVVSPEPSLRVRNLQNTVIDMHTTIKFERKCGECAKNVSNLKTNLSWETMEFCNEQCLGKYQWLKLSKCTSCGAQIIFADMGKYGVRFGYDIQQFCNSACLQKYKVSLKLCACCHKDISGATDARVASIGQEEQFKNFCTANCIIKYAFVYEKQVNPKQSSNCLVCKKQTDNAIEFEYECKTNVFCGDPCFAAFKFIKDVVTDKCGYCRQHFDTNTLKEYSMYYEDAHHAFCSEACKHMYLITDRKVTTCMQCNVNKYTFDVIKRKLEDGGELTVCSLHCFNLHQTQRGNPSPRAQCSYCQKILEPMDHNFSEVTVAMFCSIPCLIAFRKRNKVQFVPLDVPSKSTTTQTSNEPKKTPKSALGSVTCQTSKETILLPTDITRFQPSTVVNAKSLVCAKPATNPRKKAAITQKSIREECSNSLPKHRNATTMCRALRHDKGVQFQPTTLDKEVQTDPEKPIVLPIPVPVYVPAPVCMYSLPFPVPFPFPIPIPVPIFIPTSCKSVAEIKKKIQDVKDKISLDPLEAELITMAQVIADTAQMEISLETRSNEKDILEPGPEGDDMSKDERGIPQLAPETVPDWDQEISPVTTIVVPNDKEAIDKSIGRIPDSQENTCDHNQPTSTSSKRSRDSSYNSKKKQKLHSVQETETAHLPQREPADKVEAEMCLKYMLGMQAWNDWVSTKNATLGKYSDSDQLFNTDILQFSVSELSYRLCLFVKEVRKFNGEQYSPDTIYYFCLCIQKYLLKNGRTDNIFFDLYYENFTACLDKVAQRFFVLCDASENIITRISEEHLWESNQLGVHSPYVLLNTIMYFNTKFFKIETIDAHSQLSFLEVMHSWKYNLKDSGTNKVAAQEDMIKVQEKLRCPVKLYDFYLSKCPVSVINQETPFYLLPERHCTADSPVWFSTRALPANDIQKMLNRIKFVKEINVALFYD